MTDEKHQGGRAIEPRSPRPPIASGGSALGIVPGTIEEVQRLAAFIHASKLAPYQLRSAEAVGVVILKGLELGLPPMAALSGMTVINGKPAVYGDLVMAQIRRSGELESWKEWFEGTPFEDTFTAYCTMKRRGEEPITNEYSVADAKLAGLWGKMGGENNDKPTPWITNPKRMMKFRVRHFTSRDVFQDILLGLDIAEELQDAVDSGTMPERGEAPDAPDAARPMTRAESREAGRGAIELTTQAEAPEPPVYNWAAHDQRFQAAMQRATTLDEVGEAWQELYLSVPLDQMPEEMNRRFQSVYQARMKAVTPAKTESAKPTTAAATSTWGELLAAFRERIANEGHDTNIRDMLARHLADSPPPKIQRDFMAAAEQRIRELDGDRGPALAKEPTPDEQDAAGPPSPPEPRDEGFWARHEKSYRTEIGSARNLTELASLTAKFTLPDMPADLKTRMQNASATVAERINSAEKPPVSEGKATFASDDERETACDEMALKMRRARTLAELDNVASDLAAFLDSHVIDRENAEKLQGVMKQRRRLLENKARQT